jgi:inosine/xanthosine triphosphatase
LVRVGSRNTAKLEAVRRGLAPFVARVEVVAGDAASGVDSQPLGYAEIVAGARNRARTSHSAGACDLAAGIEDGLIAVPEVPTGWVNVGCCVLFDGAREGIGFSAGFEYPPDCVAEATHSPRTPIGDAFDRRFKPRAGARDPGPGAGNIGRLTEGALTRADYGAQAVTCAWLRFMHRELYAEGAR